MRANWLCGVQGSRILSLHLCNPPILSHLHPPHPSYSTPNNLFNIHLHGRNRFHLSSMEQSGVGQGHLVTSLHLWAPIEQHILLHAFESKDWSVINHTSSAATRCRSTQLNIGKQNRSIRAIVRIHRQLNKLIFAHMALTRSNSGQQSRQVWSVDLHLDWKWNWSMLQQCLYLQWRYKGEITADIPNCQNTWNVIHCDDGTQWEHGWNCTSADSQCTYTDTQLTRTIDRQNLVECCSLGNSGQDNSCLLYTSDAADE